MRKKTEIYSKIKIKLPPTPSNNTTGRHPPRNRRKTAKTSLKRHGAQLKISIALKIATQLWPKSDCTKQQLTRNRDNRCNLLPDWTITTTSGRETGRKCHGYRSLASDTAAGDRERETVIPDVNQNSHHIGLQMRNAYLRWNNFAIVNTAGTVTYCGL